MLHGQWSSPVAANVNGRIQVLFGGGDGWLRSYDAASGHEVWRFDGNPKDARWLPRPGVLSRGSIIASPVFDDGRVFVAMGQSPGHGNGPSLIHAISPNGQGDVTESRLLWTSREVGRVVGTPIAKDGLLYVGDLGGTIHCLDAATGAHVWKHETNEAIWGSLLLAGDRLYVGNVAGSMTVLRAGRRKQLLGQIEMDAPLYSPPALIGDALYLATASRLYLIAATLDPKRVERRPRSVKGVLMSSAQSGPNDTRLVSLADEKKVEEILGATVLGLWRIVNTLTRLRPSRRERYRVAIFGSARAQPGSFAYEEVKRAAAAFASLGCDIVTAAAPGSCRPRTKAR